MTSLDLLFADRTFPETRRYLTTVAPDLRSDVGDLAAEPARRWSTTVVAPLMTRIDGAVMDRIDGLRLIQQWGAGLEGVDIPAATARGIAVGNIPSHLTGNAECCAEWCVMVAMALGRDLAGLERQMRGPGQPWGAPIGRSLLGHRALILGLGSMGKALAARLRPFGMEVTAATRTVDPMAAEALGLAAIHPLAALGDLLAEADYVFLCLPLSAETRGLMNGTRFGQMKEGACLINAGRGGLVDQEALLAALESGRLGGAALDVFTPEPFPPSHALLAHPRLLATPHIAGVTDWAYQRTARHMAAAVAAVAARAPIPNCLNWEIVADRVYREDGR